MRESGNRCRACPNPQFPIPNPGCYGFTNRSVIRSLSPIAWYLASSASSWLLLGGSVHTPLGWSLVSFVLALASLVASRLKPAASAISRNCCWTPSPDLSQAVTSAGGLCLTKPPHPEGLKPR